MSCDATVTRERKANCKSVSESIIINGVNFFPHQLEAALDTARIDGLVPSYTVVFPHRPKGWHTEVLCVVYLPSYASDNVLA